MTLVRVELLTLHVGATPEYVFINPAAVVSVKRGAYNTAEGPNRTSRVVVFNDALDVKGSPEEIARKLGWAPEENEASQP